MLYEKPTPTGASMNSVLATRFHANGFCRALRPSSFTRNGPFSYSAASELLHPGPPEYHASSGFFSGSDAASKYQ